MGGFFQGRPPIGTAFQTSKGRMLLGRAEDVLAHSSTRNLQNKVQLLFTSPPFPLNRKKRYGNLQGAEYLDWLAGFAEVFTALLTDDGSIVLELGNAWVQGTPTMSTLAVEALLEFKKRGNLHLCQEFIWHNPARLPTPVQWVNVERIRVKDSFTRFWWLSPSPRPKANNRNVLKEYSASMERLLQRQEYNAGKRPSGHSIGRASFLRDNKGAIPSNVLTVGNTRTGDQYQEYCRKLGLDLHPARMPMDLAEFFIRFLTDEGDLVVDPFAGSNTTGAAAEKLSRYWLSIEPSQEYVQGAIGRFTNVRVPGGSAVTNPTAQ